MMTKTQLKIKDNKYFTLNDKPFFPIFDTAWSLFHFLSKEEIKFFLQTRKEQGFTVIMASIIAEFDDFTKGNSEGQVPFDKILENEVVPNEKYFKLVDFAVDCAKELGLVMGLLPTWGDKWTKRWGIGPEIFTTKNILSYATFLGNRYKNYENVMYVLGGDRPLEGDEHRLLITTLGRELKRINSEQLVTYHPDSSRVSSEFCLDYEFIDFHMSQSGHGIETCYSCDELLKLAKKTNKLVIDGESRYDMHPACWREDYGYFWNEDDIRQNNYINMLTGARAIVYGNHCIWSFTKEVNEKFTYHWKDALQTNAVKQLKVIQQIAHKHGVYECYMAEDFCTKLFPDAIFSKVYCAKNESKAFVFSPIGLPVLADCSKLNSPRIKATLIDTKTGEEKIIAIYPPQKIMFNLGTSGKGNDYLLMLEGMN